jgi:hypothetical protein
MFYAAIMFSHYERFYSYGLKYDEGGPMLISWYIGIGAIFGFKAGHYSQCISGGRLQYLIRARSRRSFFTGLLFRSSLINFILTISFFCILITVDVVAGNNIVASFKSSTLLSVLVTALILFTLLNLQLLLETVAGVLPAFLLTNAYVLAGVSLVAKPTGILAHIFCLPNLLMYLRIGSTSLLHVIVLVALANTFFVFMYYYVTARKDIV